MEVEIVFVWAMWNQKRFKWLNFRIYRLQFGSMKTKICNAISEHEENFSWKFSIVRLFCFVWRQLSLSNCKFSNILKLHFGRHLTRVTPKYDKFFVKRPFSLAHRTNVKSTNNENSIEKNNKKDYATQMTHYRFFIGNYVSERNDNDQTETEITFNAFNFFVQFHRVFCW